MRKVIFSILLFCFSFPTIAQQYTVNGQVYDLKTAVEGELDLLWKIIDKQYHYFVKTNDNTITELLNTKNDDNYYQEEYKKQLKSLTEKSIIPTDNLKFILSDLSQFFKTYNASISNSTFTNEKADSIYRLGLFGGLTNQPFISNPLNKTVPFFGAEFEALSEKTPKHAVFLSVDHSLDHDDFKYQATQIALGYRYRFVNKSAFNIYGNLLLVTHTFSRSKVIINNATQDIKNSTLKIPLAFGIGSDIKISKHSFITLAYNNIIALLIENNSNFPVNMALGYKFNL